ncbi:MAG TPA: hypothetical protein VLI91_00405 [Roseiarcus sp.]|nr:hypothetical protein [Roseiarcus sp.]
MLEQDSDRKADHNLAAPYPPGVGLSPTHDPKEGARLIRAFLRIGDPAVRAAVVQMVEKMGGAAPTDC